MNLTNITLYEYMIIQTCLELQIANMERFNLEVAHKDMYDEATSALAKVSSIVELGKVTAREGT